MRYRPGVVALDIRRPPLDCLPTGAPALLLYRGVLGRRDRFALASYSATALPLVVAITEVAIQDGHMRTTTASALLGAAIISTVVFPFLARTLRRGRTVDTFPEAAIEASAVPAA